MFLLAKKVFVSVKFFYRTGRLRYGRIWLILMIFWQGCSSPQPYREVDLHADWQLKWDDSTWLPAHVPGDVVSDLWRLGRIDDPLVGDNAAKLRWLENRQWEYRKIFTLSAEEMAAPHKLMIFDGLDTYADVYLNGRLILQADNMFRKWRVPVDSLLQTGNNELLVVFAPPLLYNRERLRQLPYALPAWNTDTTANVGPFTRKAAYQFGWDFAPRLVTMGIWQPVKLALYEVAYIDQVRFEPGLFTAQEATYTAKIRVMATATKEVTLTVADVERTVQLQQGVNNLELDFAIQNPVLWQPNGWGEPHLYSIPVAITADGTELQHKIYQLGVRTIELVQKPDSIGRSFYFKLNDRPIMIKGANWTPLSVLPATVPDSLYRQRLQAVKQAGINMLRVWGGGIYEKDIFYDLCDRYGILVWQDFMFANTMYPPDEALMANIADEVFYQVGRLQHHPSIALWNGNNEIEVAWHHWGWQAQYGYSPADSAALWQAYLQLFRQTIPDILHLQDPSRPYTTTSPQSNWGPQGDYNHGSMHDWRVWHGRQDIAAFKEKVGRFVVEYGFQSYPAGSTVQSYTAGKPLQPGSDPALSHQRSYIGDSMMVTMAEKYFGKAVDFEYFIEKSQQVQALALKYAIESHRLQRQRCGGTLFWQLQDCWPAPGWSVIDYFGRPKTAWQVVQDRYKPVIIIPEIKNGQFDVYLANDRLQDVKGKLLLEFFDNQDQLLWRKEWPAKVPANSVASVYRSHTGKILDGSDPATHYLKITLLVAGKPVDVEYVLFVQPGSYRGDKLLSLGLDGK